MRYNKALFLDLDGTLIETKSGEDFAKDINDWRFISGMLNKIAIYSDEGYIICIVSNQGGISKGYYTEQFIIDKLDDITKEVEQEIGKDVNTIFCPYLNGYYRKPAPGMAYELALKLDLNLKESVMVGDTDSDRIFAINAGIGEFYFASEFLTK
jgi:D-glycero-D-manno-heptose 1,7-bisphosphate phosphatase